MTLTEAIAIVRQHAEFWGECITESDDGLQAIGIAAMYPDMFRYKARQTPEALRLVADAAEDRERLDWVCQQIEKASVSKQAGLLALFGKIGIVAERIKNGTPTREAIDAIRGRQLAEARKDG